MWISNLEHTLQDISPPAPFVRDIDVSYRAAIDHGQQGHFKLNSRSIEEDLLSFQDTDARGAQLDPPNFPDSESSHMHHTSEISLNLLGPLSSLNNC